MNNIRINFTIDSLSHLDSLGGNNYRMVIKFMNSAGGPLNSPNIQNVNSVTFNTTSTTFSVDVPILDGSYNIPNVSVLAYANDEQDCCIANGVVNIVNTPVNNCNITINASFIQCNGIIGAEISGGQGALGISIYTTSDSTERFTSKSGNFYFFTPKPGTHIYVIKVTDASGCIQTKEIALGCGTSTPTFTSEVIQPTCSGNLLTVGRVRIFNAGSSTRYKVSYSATFTADNCASSDGIINQGADTIINIFPPNPGQSYPVTIRVYDGNGCDSYKDIFFTQTSPVCEESCNLTFTVSNPIC